MGRMVWDWYRDEYVERPSPSTLGRLAAGFPGEDLDLSGSIDEVGRHIPPMDAPEIAPQLSGAFVRLRWGRVVVVVAVLAGGVAELAIIWVAYELVDLSISLMEVWAELARKHLELTL